MVSDGYDRSNPTQCGLPYDPTTQGQSPAFTCNVSGQYVWMILNSTNGKSLQVCEAEIYATGIDTLIINVLKIIYVVIKSSFQN